MIRILSIATILLLCVPAIADSVPPLSPQMRAKFDKVMAGLWHEDCQCWRFLLDGELTETSSPLSDNDRWVMMEAIERGLAIPIEKQTGPY